MPKPVHLASPAHADLQNILLFLQAQSPAKALSVLKQVKKALARLGAFLEIGSVMTHPAFVVETRRWGVARTPFILVYEVKPEAVWVTGVLHHAQDWPKF